jgi:hypothetical protein
MEHPMNTEILDRIQLRQGGGAGDPRTGLCVMELVSWLAGADETSDHPLSSSPALTRFAIALNDTAPSGRTRNSLKALAPVLAGTYCPHLEDERANYVLRETAHQIVVPALRNAGHKHLARVLRAVRGREEIGFVASAILPQLGPGVAFDLVAYLSEAASGPTKIDLAEQILVRADRLSDVGQRQRLKLWRGMRKILEGAARIGPHGIDEAALDARLDALAEKLWPRERHHTVLPNWLDALVNGPAGTPALPAPKKLGPQLKPFVFKVLEDA